MLLKFVQFLNAYWPIEVVISERVTVLMPVHPSKKYSGTWFLKFISMQLLLPIGPTEVKDEHPVNIPSPKLIILSGTITFSREEQPLNARFPMLVVLLGIWIDFRAAQFMNAASPMVLSVTGRDTFRSPLQP